MGCILRSSYFIQTPTKVARDLLGKYLVRREGRKLVSAKIVETEAYDGEKDLACHASKGRTKRNDVLYRTPGTLYIYFVYGMHNMLNVVTREEGYPAAVLIRAVEGVVGPGRVTRSLGINRDLDGLEAIKKNGVWFEDRGVVVPKRDICASARIGVEYAGPVWSKKPWRFELKTQKTGPTRWGR